MTGPFWKAGLSWDVLDLSTIRAHLELRAEYQKVTYTHAGGGEIPSGFRTGESLFWVATGLRLGD